MAREIDPTNGEEYDTDSTGYSLDNVIGTLGGAAKQAAGVYGALTGNGAATANSNARAAAAQSPLSKYLPWAIGGLIVIVILAIFTRK